MLRTELAELVVHGFQVHGIELCFEAKMADAAFEPKDFEFVVGPLYPTKFQAKNGAVRPLGFQHHQKTVPSREATLRC